MNNSARVALFLLAAAGLAAGGCEGTLKPQLRPTVEKPARAFPTPAYRLYSQTQANLQKASSLALATMGFEVDSSGELLVTSEKQLKIHEMSRVGDLPGPKVFCTLTVAVDGDSMGNSRVTPHPRMVIAPTYNPDSRVPIDLPGWEMELRKEFFDQLAAAL